MSNLSIAAVAGLALTAVASARPTYTNSTPVNIPDNTPAGITSSIIVNDSFTIGAGTTVSFGGLRHTWIGDLIFTLTHVPSGTSVTFLNRPGSVSGSVGSSADFSVNNSYSWADGGLPIQTASTPTIVPSGTYAPTNPFAAFNGLNAQGEWRLFASDNASLDTGGWNSWSLTLVPTPGAAAVFGLAGLAGLRRRR